MPLTQITTPGLANGAVTSSKINASVQLGGPTISQIQITDSSYNVLDDTAVSTSGGYIKITGTGFAAGAIVVIGSTNATSTGFVSSTVLNVQVPALSAGTYTVYVVNSNGGTAIGVNGLTYSAEPNWVTSSTLPNGTSGGAISIQLDATEATTYTLQAGSTLPTGLTLTSGGLLSGTVTVGIETIYSFTVVATDAQSQDSPRAFTITITSGDPYFYLTTLLLPGNGTNNGTNNTFIDGSTNNFTITRYGNTTQGTFSPFSQTGWGNYFDGSGDYCTLSSNASMDFGTGNFTIECWVFTGVFSVSAGASRTIIGNSGNSNTMQLYIDTTSGRVVFGNTGSTFLQGTSTVADNQWHHVVVVRSGTGSNQIALFVDGNRQTLGTNSQNYTSGTIYLGSFDTANGFWNGYISNLRIVKGTAVYDPTVATLTVPTAPLTAITNTALLTFQSNRFLDNSTNAYTITRNGDVSVQAFSPFNPTAAWSAATNGGSGYFDGTTDSLTVPAGSAFAYGTGDFTVEGWFYATAEPVAYGSALFTQTVSGTNYFACFLGSDSISPSRVVRFQFGTSGGGTAITTSSTYNLNSWNHFAIVRNSGSVTVYLNGVGGTSGSCTQNFSDTSYVPTIGSYTHTNVNMLTGYLSNFRVVKGTAVYTSNFTPPTAPVTAIANTSVLCNFTNGQITDATSKNILETVGDAKISTAQSKWGGSSIIFDGTGDYLTTIPSNLNNFRTSNWTIEFWIKSTQSTRADIFGWNYSFSSAGWGGILSNLSTSGDIAWYENTNARISASGTGWNNGSWNHIAVTRNGNSVRMFVNGVQVGSTYTTSFSYGANSSGLIIGTIPGGGGALNGYINDFRITYGYARYTSNFTPPTSAFQTQ